MKQEWILCDLHTHSHYSKINKKGDKDKVKEMSAEDFVNTLKNNKVKLFSITDHNYFSKEYYEEINNYINSKELDMKIIIGTELDTYIEGEENHFIHICFYFEDSVDKMGLEKAINNLYVDSKGNELKPSFSKILDEFYKLNTKFIVIPHGDKDKRGIFEVVRKNKLSENAEFYKYAMYKIYNAYDVKPNFYDSSINHWAANFYRYTKSFRNNVEGMTSEQIKNLEKNIVKKIKDPDFPLSNIELEIYQYIMDYGNYYAYFSFSDWHNNEKYEPKINNFIFGDLDLAFESFEMATLDPESRIQLSKDDYIEIPTTMLKEVSFKINGKENRVQFSPGLNAIVGKRGSGKSLLISVIKDLVNKETNDGALKLYKDLNISDIYAEDRGGVSISLGSLNSVEILSQNNIIEIFENPSKAEKEISKNFKNVQTLDMTKIGEIIEIAKKLKPFDINYKAITNNINSLKKIDTYSLKTYQFSTNNSIETDFNTVVNDLKNVKNKLNNLHLNTEKIDNEIDKIEILKDYYIKLSDLYGSIISKHNNKITEINTENTTNESVNKTNINAINSAKEIMFNNLEMKLLLEKLYIAVNECKIDNPSVEICRKGKYLFASYYEVPEDVNEKILEKLTKTIYRSSTFDDIKSFVFQRNNKKFNNKIESLSHYLETFSNDEIFECKNTFYEIVNEDIDYVGNIKKLNDLEKFEDSKDLINLTKASLGTKSVAYLNMLFDLEDTILVLDQPEDNIDNEYISNSLVPNIKKNKKIKQLIFVTHNPSVAVYGDAFNYIFVTNENEIEYKNYFIEKKEDKDKLLKILEGGRNSFSNRNKKFGNILGVEEYENN